MYSTICSARDLNMHLYIGYDNLTNTFSEYIYEELYDYLTRRSSAAAPSFSGALYCVRRGCS